MVSYPKFSFPNNVLPCCASLKHTSKKKETQAFTCVADVKGDMFFFRLKEFLLRVPTPKIYYVLGG